MKLSEMTYDQLVDFTSEVIEELRKKAYKEGYEQGRFDERMESGFKAVGKKVDEMGALKALGMDFFKKSPQEERDRIVEQAKNDIFDLKRNGVKDGMDIEQGNKTYHHVYYVVDFVVNREKRTCVALIRSRNGKIVREKGIAKCHPNDCFNVYIGKAIALRRALGLKVPPEYLYAPQPTEKRIGDIVEYNGNVSKIMPCDSYNVFNRECAETSLMAMLGKIIDDSRDE